jgi:hypothetical protein
LIVAVVAAVYDAEVRQELEFWLETSTGEGWENQVAAIHRVLDGEQDEEILCESLNYLEASIIHAILRGIENPDTLKELLEE